MELNEKQIETVRDLRELKDLIADLSKQQVELETKLREWAGDDEIVQYQGVTVYTYKRSVRTSVDGARLKEMMPNVYNEFVKTTDVRTLRVL